MLYCTFKVFMFFLCFIWLCCWNSRCLIFHLVLCICCNCNCSFFTPIRLSQCTYATCVSVLMCCLYDAIGLASCAVNSQSSLSWASSRDHLQLFICGTSDCTQPTGTYVTCHPKVIKQKLVYMSLYNTYYAVVTGDIPASAGDTAWFTATTSCSV